MKHNNGRSIMYVKINRNVCDHQLPICERCLGMAANY
jgi:hypothetical protein